MVPYIEDAFILSRFSAYGRKRTITSLAAGGAAVPRPMRALARRLRLGRARFYGIKAVELPMLRAWIRLFW